MNALSSSLPGLALLAITTFCCSSSVSKHDLRHPRHTSLTRKDKVCQSDKRQPSKVRQQFLESVAAIKGRVVRIEIKGNLRVDSEAIIESIKTKAGDDLNASRIGKDVQNIWNLDLFDDIWVEVEEIPEGLVVKYNVLEKPVYAKVFYAGITQENVITIDALLDTRTRQLFRPGQLIKKMEQVTRYYRQAGFKRAKIDYRTRVLDSGAIDLCFLIDEGPKFNLVAEPKDYQAFLKIKTGETFVRSKVAADMQRIHDFHKKHGHTDLDVTPATNIDSERFVVDIIWQISKIN